MMRPPCACSRMRIAAARAHRNVPRRCVRTTRSKSSSVIFHSTASRSTPAFVTMTSRRPNASTARATSASATLRLADVAGDGDRPGAGERRGLLGGARVEIVDDDGRARAGERHGVRASQALPRAGDDGDLAGEIDGAHR